MNLLLAMVLIAWPEMSEVQVRIKCFQLTGKYAVACMELRDSICTIYSPRIRNDRDDVNFTRLGEETAHCFLGDFHKKP